MDDIRRKRLLNDLKDIHRSYAQFSVAYDEICSWTISANYNGRILRIRIQFPPEFPYLPPHCSFLQPIFHPNVWSDGRICLDIISSAWVSATSVASIVLSVLSLLDDPNADSPANSEAAHLLKTDPEGYKARFLASLESFACFDFAHE